MIALILISILGQTPEFRLSAESSIVYDSAREGGGNEFSFGDFYLNPRVGYRYGILELGVDWVPDLCLLNYADPKKQNSHNEHWLRADGYASRPDWLFRISIEPVDGLRLSAGSFLSSGLKPLSGAMHYLSYPAPILLTQHYDKGFEIEYQNEYVLAAISATDGDWQVGQSSAFTDPISAANSTPTVSGKLELRVWDLYMGTTGTLGDRGSYPGQKRRQSSGVAYAGYRGDWGAVRPELRMSYVMAERNPKGDGSGKHVDAVKTEGFALEGVARTEYRIDLWAHYWYMATDDGIDGEIWVVPGDRMTGWMGGVKWLDPFGVKNLWLGASGGQILTRHDDFSLALFTVGAEF